MKSLEKSALKGSLWTTGGYGIGQVLRFLNNVILARLLAPELFGLMVLVNTFVMGIELFSDIGVGQSIVQNEKGDDPDFLNTAWTLQLIRSLCIFMVCLAFARPVANFYEESSLTALISASSVNILFAGLTSTSIASLRRNMDQAKLNLFALIFQFVSLVVMIVWAMISPTIWALVGGGLVGSALKAIASHFLIPNYRNQILLKRSHISEIINYGKWIFITSITVFLGQQTDRLVLGKLVPLELLGVYGISRALSEIFRNLCLKLGNEIVFPYVARIASLPRQELRQKVTGSRRIFLGTAMLGLSIPISFGDWIIQILYDERYIEATWMVCILCTGIWFAILGQLGDATIRGVGKPIYSAQANVIKLLILIIGLPWSYRMLGILGCLITVAVSELSAYLNLQIFLLQENLLFLKQDLLLTFALCGLVSGFCLLRLQFGLGTPFDNFFESSL